MDKEDIYARLNEAYFSDDCHEKALLDNLPRLIRDARLFVDVGASLGQYTLAASRAMRGGRIIAVEADPVRHEELERNCLRWSQDSACDLRAIHGAISDSAGEVVFYTTHSNVSGGLFPHETVADGVQWDPLHVPAFTLDEVCAEAIPDFVKADVEGAEYRLLQGASRILAAGRTVFLLELHGWDDPANPREDVRGFMRQRGFWPVAFYDHTLFMPPGLAYLREKLAAGARRYLGRA
ncbi:MAG: FkbM family methyltransferase [Gammaproteobacteria bacterium]